MSENVNTKSSIASIIVVSFIIWYIVISTKDLQLHRDSWLVIKEIPNVIGWVTLVVLWFMKWGWKFKVFQNWLVQIPNLNGTWKGEIRSNWINPQSQEKLPPIQTYLVIRQTLFKIHCLQLTKESKSSSQSAAILNCNQTGICLLEFTYTNSPRMSVHHRSKSHDGACALDIIKTPERKLLGKYWTDRNTNGEVAYFFESKTLRESFI